MSVLTSFFTTAITIAAAAMVLALLGLAVIFGAAAFAGIFLPSRLDAPAEPCPDELAIDDLAAFMSCPPCAHGEPGDCRCTALCATPGCTGDFTTDELAALDGHRELPL